MTSAVVLSGSPGSRSERATLETVEGDVRYSNLPSGKKWKYPELERNLAFTDQDAVHSSKEEANWERLNADMIKPSAEGNAM